MPANPAFILYPELSKTHLDLELKSLFHSFVNLNVASGHKSDALWSVWDMLCCTRREIMYSVWF